MKIQCSSCKSNYNIKDEKIPEAGAKIKCPKCQNIISVRKSETELPIVAADESVKDQNESNQDNKKCPFCAEKIKFEAKKCKHCGELLDDSMKSHSSQQINVVQNGSQDKQIAYESQKKSGFVAAILNFLFPGVGYMYCGNVILGLFVLCIGIAVIIFTAGIGLVVLTPIVIIDGFLCAARANKKLGQKLLSA